MGGVEHPPDGNDALLPDHALPYRLNDHAVYYGSVRTGSCGSGCVLLRAYVHGGMLNSVAAAKPHNERQATRRQRHPARRAAFPSQVFLDADQPANAGAGEMAWQAA